VPKDKDKKDKKKRKHKKKRALSMPTLVYLTGFEGWPDPPVAAGNGLCVSVTGTPNIVTSQKNTGANSLQINTTAASENVRLWTIPASTRLMVGRLYVRFASSPTNAVGKIMNVSFGSPVATIGVTTAGKWQAVIGNGSPVTLGTGPTLNQWYRIDYKVDVSTTGSMNLAWQIDGSAQTAATGTDTAADLTNMLHGPNGSSTVEMYFDDIAYSLTAGDYPLGPGGTERIFPNADGTHNAGTNVIEDNAGTDIGATTAYNKIDSNPPSATSYIRQAANGTGNYAEVLFSDIQAAHSSILAARGILAYTSETTSANTGACIMSKDSFSTSTEIFGTPATPLDMSDGNTSTLQYKAAILANVTDDTTVNALKARMGYSSDANPDPYWIDLWVEVAYVPSSGTQYNQSVDGGFTPSGTVLKQGNKTLSGGNTPAGTINKSTEKTLLGGITPSGALLKQAQKILSGALSSIVGTLSTNRGYTRSFTGDITPTGSVTKQGNKTFSGSLTPSGSATKETNKSLSGSITPGGSILKQAQKILSGSISSITGALSAAKIALISLGGTLTSGGSLSKQSNKSFSGAVTPSGTIAKSVSKAFSGTLTSAGALTKNIGKILSGALSFAGNLATEFQSGAQTFFIDLDGQLGLSGAISKITSKSFSGIVTSTGTLIKNTAKSFSGTLTSSGTLSTVIVFIKNLAGTLSMSGDIIKRTGKNLAGSLTSSGQVNKSSTKEMQGNISPIGQVNKSVRKFFSGMLSFVGDIIGLFVGNVPTPTLYLLGSKIVNINIIGDTMPEIELEGQVETNIRLEGQK
jgi:hypothetical protein